MIYEITAEGRALVARWFAEPVRHEAAPRDELAIKLAVAVTAPDVDVRAIVQTQRTETMRALQELHPAQDVGRRRLRPRLAARPRPADLRRRGRGPLARPLRVAHRARRRRGRKAAADRRTPSAQSRAAQGSAR